MIDKNDAGTQPPVCPEGRAPAIGTSGPCHGPNVICTATYSRKKSRRSLKEPLLLPVGLNSEVPVT
jgi:hypothetical protein